MVGHVDSEHEYHSKDAIGTAIKATTITGAAGLFVSTIQNSLARQNVGTFGFLTRTGGTVGTFAAMGGVYEFSKNAAANLREKDDTYNYAIGGFLSGAVLGLRFRNIPSVLGYGVLSSVVLSLYNYTGGKITGKGGNKYVDEYERKMELRKNRRRPIEETIDDIGEGRGIHGPGYAERRAERLKQRYGVDVPVQTQIS